MATLPKIAALLGDRFGRESVFVRSPYHVQVFVRPNVHHDVWVNREGDLKWKLAGYRASTHGPTGKLIKALDSYHPAESDHAKATDAVRLCRSIEDATRLARSNDIKNGIFVDAGFKDGKARISVVVITGEFVQAHGEPAVADDHNEAECQAIVRAILLYPESKMLIYSDSRHAVKLTNHPRVAWISRKKNVEADRIANLRGARPAQ